MSNISMKENENPPMLFEQIASTKNGFRESNIPSIGITMNCIATPSPMANLFPSCFRIDFRSTVALNPKMRKNNSTFDITADAISPGVLGSLMMISLSSAVAVAFDDASVPAAVTASVAALTSPVSDIIAVAASASHRNSEGCC